MTNNFINDLNDPRLRIETTLDFCPDEVIEAVEWLIKRYQALYREFPSTRFMFTVMDTTGSNCFVSVVLTVTNKWTTCSVDTARIVQLQKLNKSSHLFFGVGAACYAKSRRWEEIRADYKVPELVNWDSAVLLASKSRNAEDMLEAWTTILVAPELVL